MGKTARRKQRALQRRSALSPRNIVEHAMSECAKQVSRNRNMQTDVLKTAPETLGRVVCIAPNKGTANE
jgi:hypothetical protein